MKRGLFYHLIAKGAYIASALLLHVFLSRFFTISDYGLLSVIITVITFNYLFVNNGIRQALAITLTRSEYNRGSLIKMALVAQLAIASMLTILNIIAAPSLARFLGDERLASLLFLAAFIIPFTAFYFAQLGALNGMKLFKEESKVMTSYAVMRLLPLPLLMLAPWAPTIKTVIWGFLLGSAVVSAHGFIETRELLNNEDEKKSAPLSAFLSKSVRLCFFYMGTTLLMSIGVLFIKGLLSDDKAVGLFSAALTLSRPVYFFSVALTAVAIPCVATSFHKGETKEARTQFIFGLDLLLIVVAPLLITLGGLGPILLSTVFPAKYLAAAPTFSVLLAALFFLSLMMYSNSINHAVDDNHSSHLELFVLPLAVFLHFLLIPSHGIVGAASAMGLASFIGAFYSLASVARKLGVSIKSFHTIQVFSLNFTVFISVIALRYVFDEHSWLALIVVTAVQLAIHAITANVLGLVDLHEQWSRNIWPKMELLRAGSNR